MDARQFDELIRLAKAEAWDEGKNARRDYRGDVLELNPYRSR